MSVIYEGMFSKEKLKPGVDYTVPIKEGYLNINVSMDPDYPGVDIEYIPNNGTSVPCTLPRVLIEAPVDDATGKPGKLRALIWNNPNGEDYTEKVEFEDL